MDKWLCSSCLSELLQATDKNGAILGLCPSCGKLYVYSKGSNINTVKPTVADEKYCDLCHGLTSAYETYEAHDGDRYNVCSWCVDMIENRKIVEE